MRIVLCETKVEGVTPVRLGETALAGGKAMDEPRNCVKVVGAQNL